MTNPDSIACDEALLDRYLDGELSVGEKAQLNAHLDECAACRRQVAAMQAFSQHLRERVRQADDSVDFVTLEKKVLTDALHRHHRRSRRPIVLDSMKYVIPIAAAAGLLIFFAYSAFMTKTAPPASAIIDAFEGPVSPVSSVLVYETPATGQTILWYHEAPDAESGQHAQ